MPVAASTSMSFQCDSRARQSCFRYGQENQNATAKAPTQRQNDSATAGMCISSTRPTTILLAHNKLHNTSSVQAEFQRPLAIFASRARGMAFSIAAATDQLAWVPGDRYSRRVEL